MIEFSTIIIKDFIENKYLIIYHHSGKKFYSVGFIYATESSLTLFTLLSEGVFR
jgi:hypothetical protein